jgi:hypothetical protein
VVTAAATAVTAATLAGPAAARVLGPATPVVAATAGTAAAGALLVCDGRWHDLPQTTFPDNFVPRTTSASGPRDAWVAGDVPTTSLASKPVTMHWNGTGWRAGSVPGMQAVQHLVAVRPGQVWAEGYDADFNEVYSRFDGTRWIGKKFPNSPLGFSDSVNELVATPAGDAWTVGWRLTAEPGAAPMIQRWDGTGWQIIPLPVARAPHSVLLAGVAGQHGDLWAVGSDIDLDTLAMQAYVVHLVGSKATRIDIPKIPGMDAMETSGLTVLPNGDLLAVGWAGFDSGEGRFYPFSALRHGSRWTMSAAPNATPPWGFFNGVAQLGPSVWAGGSAWYPGNGRTPFQQLTGTGWSAPQDLDAHPASRLTGITGLASGEGWATAFPDDPKPFRSPGTVMHLCPAPAGQAAAPATASSAPTGPAALTSAAARRWPSALTGMPDDGLPGSRSATRLATLHASAALQLRSAHPLGGPAAVSLRKAVPGVTGLSWQPVCGSAAEGAVRCLSQVASRTVAGAARPAAVACACVGVPIGYGPPDLRAAYRLPATGGAGRIIAIVDAFGYPRAEHDLAVYRQAAQLPPCTVASGCLTIVNQRNGRTPPATVDDGWALEQALDLDAASAVCPDCRLLLVQADNPFDHDLIAAQQTAAARGAFVISDSFGRRESTADLGQAGTFDPAGSRVFVASGDNGYGLSYPASLPDVVAVGGTTLLELPGSARGYRESAWAWGGSGCSAQQPRPAWQSAAVTGCRFRATADVSAVADPASGLGVYDSRGFDGVGGWFVVGGTSLATPVVAARAALVGDRSGPAGYWTGRTPTFDVASGSNGWCTPVAQCHAVPGYDAPTGWGSVRG